MIKNAIFFYYRNDPIVKDYFFKCALKAEDFLNMKEDIVKTHISDSNCNFAYLDSVEFPKHNIKSLLLIYSHGDAESFYKTGDSCPFICKKIPNESSIKGGLVYTNACKTGEEFGKNIVAQDGSFYGYCAEVKIFLSHEEHFIECDNYGLFRLVQGDTLKEAKNRAKEKFNEKIDLLTKVHPNSVVAAQLRKARDNLVIYGNLNNPFL